MSDKIIAYEERNWGDLALKFIEKNQSAWDDFVLDEYEKFVAGQDWEDPE